MVDRFEGTQARNWGGLPWILEWEGGRLAVRMVGAEPFTLPQIMDIIVAELANGDLSGMDHVPTVMIDKRGVLVKGNVPRGQTPDSMTFTSGITLYFTAGEGSAVGFAGIDLVPDLDLIQWATEVMAQVARFIASIDPENPGQLNHGLVEVMVALHYESSRRDPETFGEIAEALRSILSRLERAGLIRPGNNLMVPIPIDKGDLDA